MKYFFLLLVTLFLCLDLSAQALDALPTIDQPQEFDKIHTYTRGFSAAFRLDTLRKYFSADIVEGLAVDPYTSIPDSLRGRYFISTLDSLYYVDYFGAFVNLTPGTGGGGGTTWNDLTGIPDSIVYSAELDAVQQAAQDYADANDDAGPWTEAASTASYESTDVSATGVKSIRYAANGPLNGNYLWAAYNDSGDLVSYLDEIGVQRWDIRLPTYIGQISYSGPGGEPGIIFYDELGLSRSQMKQLENGGIAFGATTGTGNPGEEVLIRPGGKLGVAGRDPFFDLDVGGTGAIRFPKGTTSQRPTSSQGLIRFNTETDRFDGYDDAWFTFARTDEITASGDASAAALADSITVLRAELDSVDNLVRSADLSGLKIPKGTLVGVIVDSLADSAADKIATGNIFDMKSRFPNFPYRLAMLLSADHYAGADNGAFLYLANDPEGPWVNYSDVVSDFDIGDFPSRPASNPIISINVLDPGEFWHVYQGTNGITYARGHSKEGGIGQTEYIYQTTNGLNWTQVNKLDVEGLENSNHSFSYSNVTYLQGGLIAHSLFEDLGPPAYIQSYSNDGLNWRHDPRKMFDRDIVHWGNRQRDLRKNWSVFKYKDQNFALTHIRRKPTSGASANEGNISVIPLSDDLRRISGMGVEIFGPTLTDDAWYAAGFDPGASIFQDVNGKHPHRLYIVSGGRDTDDIGRIGLAYIDLRSTDYEDTPAWGVDPLYEKYFTVNLQGLPIAMSSPYIEKQIPFARGVDSVGFLVDYLGADGSYKVGENYFELTAGPSTTDTARFTAPGVSMLVEDEVVFTVNGLKLNAATDEIHIGFYNPADGENTIFYQDGRTGFAEAVISFNNGTQDRVRQFGHISLEDRRAVRYDLTFRLIRAKSNDLADAATVIEIWSNDQLVHKYVNESVVIPDFAYPFISVIGASAKATFTSIQTKTSQAFAPAYPGSFPLDIPTFGTGAGGGGDGTGTDDQTAAEVPIAAFTGFSSTNVQDQLEEHENDLGVRPIYDDVDAAGQLVVYNADGKMYRSQVDFAGGGVYNFEHPNATLLNSNKSFTLQETGDVFGDVSLSLRNRTGQNGMRVTATHPTITLADLQLKTIGNPFLTLRNEARASKLLTGGTLPEFQLFYITSETGTATPYLTSGQNKTIIHGTGGLKIPIGTDAQRWATQGAIRYNTTGSAFEGYNGSSWVGFSGADNLGNHTATTDLNMASFKVTSLATPTATTDAANKAYVDGISVNDADSDPTNELQTVSKVGSIVTLSNGGGTFSVIDPDGSPTNELQTISKTGTTVTLSDGGGSFEANNIFSKVLNADVSNNSTTTYTTILSFDVQSGRVYSGSVKLWFSPVAGESMQLRINPTSGTISGDLVDARDATATAVTNNSPITITDYASTGVSSTTLDFTFTATATTTANIQFRKAATGAGFSHIVEKGTKVVVDYIAE